MNHLIRSPRELRPAPLAAHRSRTTPLTQVAARFEPTSLAEMEDVALLNRVDTKYVLGAEMMLSILRGAAADYRILEVEGVRLNPYQTLYFDTADFALYHHHHAEVPSRYKVRSRAYLETGLTFLEVKHRYKGRTVKERTITPSLVTSVTAEVAAFLDAHYPDDPLALQPTLWNRFTRLTLVSRRRAERVTVDFAITFQRTGHRATLGAIAVAEVKQDGADRASEIMAQLRQRGIRPNSFSKYCIGAAMLFPQLKQNRFKAQRLLVEKIQRASRLGPRRTLPPAAAPGERP